MSVDDPIDIPSIDEETRQELIEEYPEWALYLDDPEILEILLWAQGEEEVVDIAIIEGRIRQTSWWQGNADSVRQWDYARLYDPATAAASIEDKIDEFAAFATRYGIKIRDDILAALAENAIRFDWESEEIEQSMLDLIGTKYASVTNYGTIAGHEQFIRQEAAKYLTKMDDEQARSMAMQMAAGQIDQSSVTLWAQQQAKARWNYLENIWDKGITPEDYFRPVRQRVADTLEIGVDQIDLMNSRWDDLTQVRDDDGTIRAMTTSEAERWARRQDDFKRTDRYRNEAYDLAGSIRRLFGNF